MKLSAMTGPRPRRRIPVAIALASAGVTATLALAACSSSSSSSSSSAPAASATAGSASSTAAAAAAPDPAKPTVLLDWFPNPDHSSLYLAQAKGDFTKAGLSEADLPKTWDQTLAVAEKLTGKDRYGVMFETLPGYYQNFTWYPFLWQGDGTPIKVRERLKTRA